MYEDYTIYDTGDVEILTLTETSLLKEGTIPIFRSILEEVLWIACTFFLAAFWLSISL